MNNLTVTDGERLIAIQFLSLALDAKSIKDFEDILTSCNKYYTGDRYDKFGETVAEAMGSIMQIKFAKSDVISSLDSMATVNLPTLLSLLKDGVRLMVSNGDVSLFNSLESSVELWNKNNPDIQLEFIKIVPGVTDVKQIVNVISSYIKLEQSIN